jgi:hypothetical protein
MTKYTLSWLDKVPGITEQLLLTTIAQELANQDYVHPAILTDFTANSVKWNMVLDSGGSASIPLTYQFVLDTFARQSLLDSTSTLDRRISSVNSLHIDEVSLTTKSAYPQQSFPVRNLPTYLSTDNVENTLERRIVYLLLQIMAIQGWIGRWNSCVNNWLARVHIDFLIQATNPNLPTLVEIELARDNLIAELNTGIKLSSPIFSFGIALEIGISYGAEDITGAQSELAYLNGGTLDPANEVTKLSSGLLSQLKEQLQEYENQFGGIPSESPVNVKSESPTLPDC